MTFFLYLAAFILGFIGLIMKFDQYTTTPTKKLGGWFIRGAVGVALWNTLSIGLVEQQVEWEMKPVFLVDNTVCTSMNGEVINLNSKLGRNFMPGDFVVIKTQLPQRFLGVHHEKVIEYFHWKDLPSETKATKTVKQPVNGDLNDT